MTNYDEIRGKTSTWRWSGLPSFRQPPNPSRPRAPRSRARALDGGLQQIGGRQHSVPDAGRHLARWVQKHPAAGLIAASCSYIPGFFPIWGNCNTFSWEPFLERTVFKNQTLSWSISYDF